MLGFDFDYILTLTFTFAIFDKDRTPAQSDPIAELVVSNQAEIIPEGAHSRSNSRRRDSFFTARAWQIPSELGQLSTLVVRLHLYRNALTGTIPSELGRISTLQELYLYENALTGPIPLAC
jgi:hypothetical protein